VAFSPTTVRTKSLQLKKVLRKYDRFSPVSQLKQVLSNDVV
jgi:hypothetical protein